MDAGAAFVRSLARPVGRVVGRAWRCNRGAGEVVGGGGAAALRVFSGGSRCRQRWKGRGRWRGRRWGRGCRR